MDQFKAYFRRVDLDGDGRISRAEAVSFFQGSSLTKQVLAQVLNFFAFSPQILHFYNSSLFLSPNMFHYNEFNQAASC